VRARRGLHRAGAVRVVVVAPQDVVAVPPAERREIEPLRAEGGRELGEREVVLGRVLRAQHDGELRSVDRL
jgi:hypothetical protein